MMYDHIERMITRAVERMERLVYAVARYTYIAKSSADGESDKVEGQPTDATDPGYQQAPQDDARRLGGTWGVWSVPPKGEPVAVLRVGGGKNNGVIVACGGKRYAPSDLNDGETAIYCKASGCTIKLDQNGGITITGAANQNVTVQTSGTGSVNVTATAVTGAVKLGPVGSLAVLVQGTTDTFGVPVTQAPAAALTIVKAG